jgi:DNA-binding transcriptional ArsR family regulator
MNIDFMSPTEKKLYSGSVKRAYKIIRALGSPTRFKIIIVLAQHRDGLTVSQIARILKFSLSRISHQLNILKLNRLIVAKRLNRDIRYKLAYRTAKHCEKNHFCIEISY